MSNDIIIHIRRGMVTVVRDAAGAPLDAIVRDFDVGADPEHGLPTDPDGAPFVEYRL
jgi:hypothetical protein